MSDGGWGRVSLEVVEHRNAMLERLEAVDVEALPADQLGAEIKLIRSTVDLLELQAARRVAAFDHHQGFYELGEHSTVDWMRKHTHVSGASADSCLTLARQLETLEPTLAAVEEGAISFEHALLVARQLEGLPESAVQPAQAELLAAAAESDPRELRKLGEEIRHRDDPDGLARLAYRQHEKRRLRLFDHQDGMLGVEGALPAPEGMKLRLCLESLIGIPARGDERSQEQRQADALSELCARAIGSGRLPRQGGRHPQLTVIVRTRAGSEVPSAELQGVGPISLGTLARLRGQDHVERKQKVDGQGVTLNFGRARRCHSDNQRQEIGTRYPSCVVRGCTVPIRDCEIHHGAGWAEGGETDVKAGLPLCRRRHHPQVSEGGYRLEPGAAGGFDLVGPPGTELRPDRWRKRFTRSGP